MIDLSNKPTENSTPFSEGAGSSIKKILGDFVTNNSPKDLKSKPGIGGHVARTSSAVKNTVSEITKDNLVDRGSIIARASRSVMQFPLYISQSIRIAEAHPIGKAFERVYASFVQNVIAQNPVITDISKVNGLRFLRDYHTNIKESADVTLEELEGIFNEYCTPIDQFDAIMTEATIAELKIPGGTVSFLACRPSSIIATESARLAHEPLEGISYLREAGGGGPSRQTNTVTNKVTNHDVETNLSSSPKSSELTDDNIKKNLDAYLSDLDITSTGDKDKDVDAIKKLITDQGQIRTAKGNIYQFEKTPEKKTKTIDDNGKTVINTEPGSEKITITRRGQATKIVDKNQTSTQTTVQKSDAMQSAVDTPVMLRDSDIKKFNGMQPFQFTVKFRVDPIYDSKTDKDGNIEETLRPGTNYEQNYILGVKTVMHPIKVKDLADDLQEIITGDRKGLQSIRYKTGEISWLKDYMLNLPSLKADAMKRLDDRRWLSTLKRLGEYEKVNGTLLKSPLDAIYDRGTPIPNATMILSRGDIERIKDETGIDIESITTAKTLAKRIYLIAIVIVDQTAGSFKVFFPDMDNDWDIQSIGAIESEIARIDNNPLMAEINRISRKG